MVISIRKRLLLASGTLLLVTCAPLVLWAPTRLDAQSLGWTERRALGIARALTGAAEAARAIDDRVGVRAELGGLARAGDAVYGAVLAPDGRRLAAWGRLPMIYPPVSPSTPVHYGDGLVHVAVASEASPGPRGTLLAGFSLAEVEARGRENRRLALGVAAFMLAFGLLGTWLLGTFMVRPLQRVTAVAQRIAAGDEGAAADLPAQSGDEVGAMAAALARTFEELRQQRARVAEMNLELSAVVEDRTTELVKTNVALADLRIAQEKLVVADRRSSLGRLAAGVGHEINNPLAYVKGNLEWVREELAALQAALGRSEQGAPQTAARFDALMGALADASAGAERIKSIVAQLRTFSLGGPDDHLEPTVLGKALDLALELVGHELKQRARVVRRDLGAPLVRGSLVQLSQVFVNLLVNAAQAVAEAQGRTHEIRATVGTDPQGRAFAEIQDTGVGIPKEDLARLFTPFFTTKPVGQGTGLGLCISQGIVRSLGGEISVRSDAGRGTSVRVVLPACAEPPLARSQDLPVFTPPPPGGARVLVVDDDPMVATALARCLARRHRPTTASSGREVLERIERGERYDVIVCDLMMPFLDGMELHAVLAARAPEQAARMIFVTGGAYTEAGRRFLDGMEGRWLGKPVDLARLDALVEARRT